MVFGFILGSLSHLLQRVLLLSVRESDTANSSYLSLVVKVLIDPVNWALFFLFVREPCRPNGMSGRPVSGCLGWHSPLTCTSETHNFFSLILFFTIYTSFLFFASVCVSGSCVVTFPSVNIPPLENSSLTTQLLLITVQNSFDLLYFYQYIFKIVVNTVAALKSGPCVLWNKSDQLRSTHQPFGEASECFCLTEYIQATAWSFLCTRWLHRAGGVEGTNETGIIVLTYHVRLSFHLSPPCHLASGQPITTCPAHHWCLGGCEVPASRGSVLGWQRCPSSHPHFTTLIKH